VLLRPLASAPPTQEQEAIAAEELEEIPSYFYNPPPPPASPLLTNLVEDREKIGIWSEGVTTVKVPRLFRPLLQENCGRVLSRPQSLSSKLPHRSASL
jgi:hypothetical protein